MEERTIWLIVLGSVFAVLLTCYITALIKSKHEEMVFTASGWDMALLLTCPILILVGSCTMENPSLATFRYVVWGFAGACLIGTTIFSIVTNNGFWKKLCSVLAKIFAVWLTMFIIMLLIAILVFYIMAFFMRDRSEDDGDFILLKYDKFLRSYVGYRVKMD